MSPISQLPRDALAYSLSLTISSGKDYVTLALVCKLWRQIIKESSFWIGVASTHSPLTSQNDLYRTWKQILNSYWRLNILEKKVYKFQDPILGCSFWQNKPICYAKKDNTIRAYNLENLNHSTKKFRLILNLSLSKRYLFLQEHNTAFLQLIPINSKETIKIPLGLLRPSNIVIGRSEQAIAFLVDRPAPNNLTLHTYDLSSKNMMVIPIPNLGSVKNGRAFHTKRQIFNEPFFLNFGFKNCQSHFKTKQKFTMLVVDCNKNNCKLIKINFLFAAFSAQDRNFSVLTAADNNGFILVNSVGAFIRFSWNQLATISNARLPPHNDKLPIFNDQNFTSACLKADLLFGLFSSHYSHPLSNIQVFDLKRTEVILNIKLTFEATRLVFSDDDQMIAFNEERACLLKSLNIFSEKSADGNEKIIVPSLLT